MDGVMLFGEFPGDLHKFDSDDLQTLVLKSGDDPTGQLPLDGIGF